MKQFKYHTSLDSISAYRLNKIRESIDNGNPEYRHMLKIGLYDDLPEISKRELQILEQEYFKLIEELPEVSTELISSFRNYFEEYIKVKVLKTKSDLENLRTGIKEKISYTNVNIAFNEYLAALHRNYTNFSIVEYYLKPDFKEIHQKEFSNLSYRQEYDILKDEIKGFYSIPEYYNEIDKLNIFESFKNLFKSSVFIEYFIDSKHIVIPELTDYIERLRENYKQQDDYEGYIELRHRIFGLNDMRFDIKGEYDFYSEVLNVKSILGFDFNIREISALEYMTYLKAVKAKIDKEKSKDKAV